MVAKVWAREHPDLVPAETPALQVVNGDLLPAEPPKPKKKLIKLFK